MSTIIPKKPDLQDFGVTPEQYAIYTVRKGAWKPSSLGGWIIVFAPSVILFLAILTITGDWQEALLLPFLLQLLLILTPPGWLTIWLLGMLVEFVIVRYKKSLLVRSDVVTRIRQYEKALAIYLESQNRVEQARRESEKVHWEAAQARREAALARRRKREDFWKSLTGFQFEQELGTLYSRLGYSVESTPRTGDEGIDIILRKDGKTTIVQCKRQNAPAGPAIARELFGSMTAFGADNGILACTGGFTRGVVDFVRGKPIALVSVSEIVEMAEDANFGADSDNKVQYKIERTPVCPVVGCGKKMVLRKGKHGEFWGCTGFPKCRGTINA